MHFVGVITRQEGETDEQAIARVITDPKAGDVVVISDNGKEYIYAGSESAWREIGDEGLYVQKSTTIAGVDLEDSITKDELLTALNVEDGAQVNIIESVKVDGQALAIDENKAVEIELEESAAAVQLAFDGSTLSAGLVEKGVTRDKLSQEVQDALQATNGAFVYKGAVETLPQTGAVGDAYTCGGKLYVCTVSTEETVTYVAIAVNSTFTGDNYKDASDNALSVKEYIDKLIFVGTQDEYDAAKDSLLTNTFVVITDEDADSFVEISDDDIDSLFA